jgi:hypothetical protein
VRARWWRRAAGLGLVVCANVLGNSEARAEDPPEPAPAPAPPTATADALLVVQNDSKVDLSIDFAQDGKSIPGCFWVLAGKQTTFALPAGKTRWAYSVSVMQLVGSVELVANQPKMLRCESWTNRYGDDDAKCKLTAAPDTLPAEDSERALAESAVAFFGQLDEKLGAKDKKALAELVKLPLEIEWGGDKPGKRKLRNALQLLQSKSHLGLDAERFAAAKGANAALRTGEADCDKKSVDWTKGDAALSCQRREVTLSLSATPPCGKGPAFDTWKLVNKGASWKLTARGTK